MSRQQSDELSVRRAGASEVQGQGGRGHRLTHSLLRGWHLLRLCAMSTAVCRFSTSPHSSPFCCEPSTASRPALPRVPCWSKRAETVAPRKRRTTVQKVEAVRGTMTTPRSLPRDMQLYVLGFAWCWETWAFRVACGSSLVCSCGFALAAHDSVRQFSLTCLNTCNVSSVDSSVSDRPECQNFWL